MTIDWVLATDHRLMVSEMQVGTRQKVFCLDVEAGSTTQYPEHWSSEGPSYMLKIREVD
jgi:hypothetical protein